MDITKQLTELFGDIELSEDVLIKMKLMMEKAIQEKTDVLNEEISKLNTDIKTLHENAEAYGIFLQEKADEYGTFLQEKADAYGKFLQENAESYGTFLQEKANDYGQYVIEEMTDNIDNYTGYVVEKFIEENKSALLEHNEYERMKSLFENVKIAFEENNFKLSENFVSNTDEIESKLEESTKSYNELYGEFVKIKKNLEEMQYSMVFENVTKDLADTQKERINNLVKNVSFSSIGEFKRGVELMVEEVVVSSKIKQLNEVEHQLELSALANEKNPVNDKMQQYLNHL
jgi:hypothetical protein